MVLTTTRYGHRLAKYAINTATTAESSNTCSRTLRQTNYDKLSACLNTPAHQRCQPGPAAAQHHG